MMTKSIILGLATTILADIYGIAHANVLNYSHVVPPQGIQVWNEADCQAIRQIFGQFFKEEFQLSGVLTTCKPSPYQRNGEDSWAVVMAYESNKNVEYVPVELHGLLIESNSVWTFSEPTLEEFAYDFVGWNGREWQQETRVFSRVREELITKTFDFDLPETCETSMQGIDRLIVDASWHRVINSKCMSPDVTGTWKIAVLATKKQPWDLQEDDGDI